MKHTRVDVANVQQHKNKLFVNRMYEYNISEDVKKQAERILNTYLKRARLALRIRGGSTTHPLVTTEVVAQGKRFTQYEDGVLLSYHEVWMKFGINEKPDPIKDIITPCKVDVNSLTLAFGLVRHGDQKWVNVTGRFRKYYKPGLLFSLMESATLEDS